MVPSSFVFWVPERPPTGRREEILHTETQDLRHTQSTQAPLNLLSPEGSSPLLTTMPPNLHSAGPCMPRKRRSSECGGVKGRD